MAPPRFANGKVTLLEAFFSLQAYPEGVQDWCKECPVPGGGWGGGGGGNGKINLEGKERGDIVAATEDDGQRQSQIEAERKVKMSEEKEDMNRTENITQGQKLHW